MNEHNTRADEKPDEKGQIYSHLFCSPSISADFLPHTYRKGKIQWPGLLISCQAFRCQKIQKWQETKETIHETSKYLHILLILGISMKSLCKEMVWIEADKRLPLALWRINHPLSQLSNMCAASERRPPTIQTISICGYV